MDPAFAYLVLSSVAFLEGGEFALIFAAFLYRLSDLSLWTLLLLLSGAFLLSDLAWYRFGTYVFRIPILRRAEPFLANLDTKITKRPFVVALIARFSYGTHRILISRYRQVGIGFGRMFAILVGTFAPWIIVVGGLAFALHLTANLTGRVFRFSEIMLALGFVMLMIFETKALTRLRRSYGLLDTLRNTLREFFGTERALRIQYGVMLLAVCSILIATPILVRDGISFFQQELVEAALIVLSLLAGFGILTTYQKRLRDVETRYHDVTKHLGALNLQTVQVNELFKHMAHLPESKRDLRTTLARLNKNILAAVPVPWVVTRIVNIESGRTLTELATTRGNTADVHIPNIPNQALLGKKRLKGLRVLYSGQENTYVRAACVIPHDSVNAHQEVVIKAAMNSLALLYLITTSQVVAHGKSNEPAAHEQRKEAE
jgi:membrane protein DedA with SNARE-associated domain